MLDSRGNGGNLAAEAVLEVEVLHGPVLAPGDNTPTGRGMQSVRTIERIETGDIWVVFLPALASSLSWPDTKPPA